MPNRFCAGEWVNVTCPQFGKGCTKPEKMESHGVPGAIGLGVREDVTDPANFRSVEPLQAWLAARGKIGLSGIDTRALTRRIRLGGAPNAVIAHDPAGDFDIPALLAEAPAWPGLEGMDLARVVSREEQAQWQGSIWHLGEGYTLPTGTGRPHIVAVDYGAKDNIFRNLVQAGADVTIVPAETSLETVLALSPAGGLLSNGPGDQAAPGMYAVPVHRWLLETVLPVLGLRAW